MSSDDLPPTDDIHTGSGLVAEKSKRLQKLDGLREQGTNPYPYRFDRTVTLRDLRAQFGELEAGTETEHQVAVAGRVMLLRDSGKLVFATMRDRDDDEITKLDPLERCEAAAAVRTHAAAPDGGAILGGPRILHLGIFGLAIGATHRSALVRDSISRKA